MPKKARKGASHADNLATMEGLDPNEEKEEWRHLQEQLNQIILRIIWLSHC